MYLKDNHNVDGSEATFRGYGVATLVVLGGYISLNYFYLGKYASDLPAPAEGEQAEESSHLAPCGVPMSSMSHSLSQSKLGDQSKPGYGSRAADSKSTNGYLDPGNSQQSGSGGYNQPPHYGYNIDPQTGSKIKLGQPDHVTRPSDVASIKRNFKYCLYTYYLSYSWK
ncbi:hypothetical protein CAPTEDRAFT_211599 [Capitella teleta]|uniref:Uncharacterized protein n=1 Tax=Capitella teleta TaxID=283909 RepID=R7TAL4_CAPTE|nr:hypothetical protein CAPTEDRAFT_211599 [Capitella teleta]|eukprot:ELT88522.1 hypothetical protein CAPTEDRAFT_211599 [Capitella teleta]